MSAASWVVEQVSGRGGVLSGVAWRVSGRMELSSFFLQGPTPCLLCTLQCAREFSCLVGKVYDKLMSFTSTQGGFR